MINGSEWTRWLDSNEYYTWASYGRDAVGVLAAAGSTSAAIRAAKAIQKATGRSALDVLKGMSRQERKRLAQELIRLDYPSISNSNMKELIKLGTFPKRLSSAAITQRLFVQLKDAISATISFSSSSVSGGLKLLYVHIFQD